MAAGRLRDLSDNDFRDHETDSDVSQRGVSHTKDYKSSRRYNDSNKSQNSGYGGRVGHKGLKTKFSDGDSLSSSRSYSSSSSDGYGKRKVSIKVVDREPGELSTETDSDSYCSIDMQPPLKDCNPSKSDNEAKSTSSNEKKRKFSPIIWDIDNSGCRKAYKTNDLPPLPSQKLHQKSPILLRNGGIHVSSTEHTTRRNHVDFPAGKNILPSLNSKHYISLKSDVLPSSPRHQEHHLKDVEGEANEVEYDSNAPMTRNISSSRWANELDPVPNDDKIPDQVDSLSRRKSPYLKSNPKVMVSASLLPRVQTSDEEMTKCTGSDARVHCRSAPMDDSDEEYYRRNDSTGSDEEEKDSDDKLNVNSCDEDGSRSRHEPIVPQRSVNMLHGCRSVDEFERLNKIDEGTYGVVYRAKDKKTGEIVALKKVKMEKEREGFPLTSLREINILLSFHHPSIVDVKEVVVGNTIDSIFMVMEYMEHDLKGLMEAMKQPFSQSEVKCLMIQLLEGVKYLHDNWVLHRDLKTSNLLLNNRGELKICDFGLSRQYGSPLKPYTHLVVTLWYRAPELLLGAKQYSTTIDMWSLGCIMAEMLSKQPLFNGKTEFDQMDKIFKTLGTPSEEIWPGFSKLPGVKVNFVKHKLPALGDSGLASGLHWYNLLRKKFPATSFTGSHVLSDSGFDLLNKFLTYDPEKRITASDALNHDWFREVPLPKSKDFMPTFPAQHDQDRRTHRMMKSPDPLEEQRRKELQQGDLCSGGIFG